MTVKDILAVARADSIRIKHDKELLYDSDDDPQTVRESLSGKEVRGITPNLYALEIEV